MSSESSESSLTAPEDRDRINRWKPDQSIAPLSSSEFKNAISKLKSTDFIKKFPRVERQYADPAISLQHIGLISFVPAKGAKPNENGVFGYAKMRGNYPNELEANERSEFIIRNVDSYNTIFSTYVGRPFPITVSSNYSKETNEVDISKDMSSSISSSVLSKKMEEKNNIDNITKREKKLIEESKTEFDDPFDNYITLKVKKAQLLFTYNEHTKKIDEIKKIIIKTRNELALIDIKEPNYKNLYFEKYMKARKEAGIVEDNKNIEENFIKYMVEDFDLPF